MAKKTINTQAKQPSKRKSADMISKVVSVSKRGASVKTDFGSVRTIQISMNTTIEDRYEGTSRVLDIWGRETNDEFLTYLLRSATVRDETSDFVLRRGPARVSNKMITTNMVRPDECVSTKAQAFAAITAETSGMSTEARNAVAEILIPYFIKCGIVSAAGEYTYTIFYPRKEVTREDLAADAQAQDVARIVREIKPSTPTERRYTKAVFSEEVAEKMFSVGIALQDTNSLVRIFDDVDRMIRARYDFDPAKAKLTGSVDRMWRDNAVIAELSTNKVFIEKAFSLFDTSINLVSEAYQLDKWLPIILAWIKTSKRYAVIGRTEVLRSMGSRRIYDLRGVPQSVVVWRSVKVEPVAQTVLVVDDDLVVGGKRVIERKERIADALRLAYGEVKYQSTDYCASIASGLLRELVENGYDKVPSMVQFDIGAYSHAENYIVAAMMSDKVEIMIDDSGSVRRVRSAFDDVVDDDAVLAYAHAQPISESTFDTTVDTTKTYLKFIFTVHTDVANPPANITGRYDGDTFKTESIAEVFMMSKELTPVESLPPKPQVFPANAFNKCHVDFDANSVYSLDDRWTFDVTIGGNHLHGNFRPIELGSLNASTKSCLTAPLFNSVVYDVVSATFDWYDNMLASVAKGSGPETCYTEGFRETMKRRKAISALKLAQSLSPAFRNEIHAVIMSRATAQMTTDESIAVKARLAQRSFGAFADIYALMFFLSIQRMNTAGDGLDNLTTDDELNRMYLQLESDRPAFGSMNSFV